MDNQISLFRRESQPKGLSQQQKVALTQNLLKLIDFQEKYNIIHTLFGFILGKINLPLDDRFIFELKKKFQMIQQLYLSHALERQAVTLIAVDSLDTFSKTLGGIGQKQSRMLESMSYSSEETLVNPHFLYDKWKHQQRLEEQNRQNQLFFKKFLQEEAAENRRRAENADSQGWECPVCLTEIDRDKFGILECSHIFHPECIAAYLRAKIEAGQTDILCPMEGCGLPVQVTDIYQYSDPDLKEKFQKFSFNKFIEKNSTITWCPTAGCTAAFEFDEALDNYRCPACSKHYCLRCKCVYHHGMTCAEYRVSNTFDKQDEDFINFVKGAKFKQCPNCNYWVERNEGCSTMTCKCGQEFCYDCGGTTCPHGMCANNMPRPVVHPRQPLRPRPLPARPVMNRKKK